MGRGIYRYQSVQAELNYYTAGGLPEAAVVAELVVEGAVTPALQVVEGTSVSVSRHVTHEGLYLVVSRFALKVKPLSASALEQLEDKGKQTDPRGVVRSLADWFEEAAGDLFVDVYNTEIVDLFPWTTRTITIDDE